MFPPKFDLRDLCQWKNLLHSGAMRSELNCTNCVTSPLKNHKSHFCRWLALLAPALDRPGAVVVDATHLGLAEVIDTVVALVHDRVGA